MKIVTKKVFYLFWSLLFLQAALETNACGIENTFNDEYDTYTAAVNVSAPNPIHIIIDFDFCYTCADVLSPNCFDDISETNIDNLYPVTSETFQPPPIHILHSIWII
ncbi:MAG: hypothetical protein LBV74_15050 [Tannerella sp.]|jgi:hypothetical protein|nr:hypothetical protein [Tannerella sp.]